MSHTADELDELVAERESGLFSPNGLIYVNRNQSHSENEVRKVGCFYIENKRFLHKNIHEHSLRKKVKGLLTQHEFRY